MKRLVSLFVAARLYILAIPFALFLFGAGLNQAVLIANGDKFPVMVNDQRAAREVKHDGMFYDDKIHCRMTDKTHLNWLADYIDLHYAILSPGDLILLLSETLGDYANVIWATIIVLEIYGRMSAQGLGATSKHG